MSVFHHVAVIIHELHLFTDISSTVTHLKLLRSLTLLLDADIGESPPLLRHTLYVKHRPLELSQFKLLPTVHSARYLG